MAIDLNDEIVQDFLIEAGEILDQLGTQLIDLEQRPDDRALLNSIFRGFHTIKGGAGFLSLDNLVGISHKAEDVFDLMRQGERPVNAVLMDVMLRVLDVLNDMFQQIRTGHEPAPANDELLQALLAIKNGEPVVSLGSSPEAAAAEEPLTETPALADAPSSAPAQSLAPVGGDDITDEEFEALLDQLQASPPASIKTDINEAGIPESTAPPAAVVAGSAPADEISDDEFEALLDTLHGDGKAPTPETLAIPATPIANVQSREIAKPNVVPPPRRAKEESSDHEEASARTNGQADSTVRVETSVLDQIMNMVGELVLIRNRLSTLEASIGNEEMTKTVQSLDVVTSDLQTAAMKTRMQPIKKVFGRFPRVVRDVARSLHKEVDLVMEGEETDLDKNLVEALADPLVHLVRNAVDHGIELPEIRKSMGKSPRGVLRLSAEQAGDHILLTITDDGAGMDPEVLRRKAVEKGLMDEDAAGRLTPRECFELIFHAGFSTKAEISDISGRGVGMDVVKTRINQLNGQIEIESAPGKGTAIHIKLPLTLAIMPTLMVVLGSQIFALPLVNVNEIIDYEDGRTNVVDGKQVMVIRGRPLPLFYLSRWLIRGYSDQPPTTAHVVVVSVGTQKYGLLVDQLVGQEEVVIKPLGALLHGTRGLAGATITGDGRIALILDLPSLMDRYARRA